MLTQIALIQVLLSIERICMMHAARELHLRERAPAWLSMYTLTCHNLQRVIDSWDLLVPENVFGSCLIDPYNNIVERSI